MLAEIGAGPEEAYARLEAATRAFALGQTDEVDRGVERALSFFRPVGAVAYCRAAEALLATRPTEAALRP